jgi:hypothetical protein
MLSPNARNFVFSRRGTGETVTVKVHDPFRDSESAASHVTVVVPFANSVPEPGVQVTVTGACPSTGVGESKFAVGCGCPWCASSEIFAGHVTVGGLGTGVGPGPGRLLPHPAIATAAATNTRRPGFNV